MRQNEIDLSGRVAVVTGAARGIGLAIADRLLASGAAVALWDFDDRQLAETAPALQTRGAVAPVVVDVTDEDAVMAAVRDTESALGAVDLLVNNAGIGGPILQTWEYDVATFRRVLDVNVTGVYLCCKALVPGMRDRNYGRVVTIASIAYGASKAAVIALTKALARETADTEVLVNAVTPSVADTDILSQFTPEKVKWMVEQVPKGRFVKSTEIAALVAWLCSDECSFSTGQLFDISGGRSVY
jgi:2-dehydro-3-deoxy-L-rhamnonate dehydrogenase (NAD+)